MRLLALLGWNLIRGARTLQAAVLTIPVQSSSAMGKKRKRLHRLMLGRWMRSDLPQDTSTVLLLAVTRIPTSPPPVHRPCSLNLNLGLSHQRCVRPKSSNDADGSTQIMPTAAAMDRSVDSIGTCSLDVDAPAELFSERAENPSVDTLRSIESEEEEEEHRLPSYLSLACTVNGYSPITNYDPLRLARSRDSSPHRPRIDNEPVLSLNLLSPPNLVPLPRDTMAQNLHQHHHEEFYAKTTTMKAKQHFSACIETFEKFCKMENGNSVANEPKKSFIQQRVERLYGPGALAQGFFVTKRQTFNSESDANEVHEDESTHSKSMCDKLLDDSHDECDASMKQSVSSPSLPVLRHLTPEFRAQLPRFSPRKGVQKSCTLPQLKNVDVPTINVELVAKPAMNGHTTVAESADDRLECSESSDIVDVKDGNYFIKILENETNRLLGMAVKAEEELEASEALGEDAKGFLRAAAGKARLLVSQKMQQFRGLCANNLNQAAGEAFPTTNEDLQGFWDMVMLQVDQVDSIFNDLDTMRANNWQEVIRKPSESNQTSRNRSKMAVGGQTKTARAISVAAEEERVKREAQRKQMIETRRKAMREAKKTHESNAVEIFVPES